MIYQCHLPPAVVEIDTEFLDDGEVKGKMKTQVVQQHSLLMYHSHLLAAMVKITRLLVKLKETKCSNFRKTSYCVCVEKGYSRENMMAITFL